MFGGTVGGLHSDIMGAEPDNKDSAVRLITEIKDRAKSSIKFKDYPSAVRLYDKAIEISKVAELTVNEHAILFANKSMVLLSMNKGDDALAAASEAISIDSTYVKAYYRRAMASIHLCDYSAAARALEDGLALAPDDKELITQRAKVEELMKSGPPQKQTASASLSSLSSSSASTKAAAAAASSSAQKPSKPSSSSDDNEEESSAEKIRGYKITEDGRKTTFFNRDLDETAKSLIGDIRPKKLDEAASAPVAAPAIAGASAWNAAGTYESYDKSPATSAAIIRHLTSMLTYSDVDFNVEFSKIEKLEGDSQLTMARGKKKLVYDYTATVAVIVRLSSGASSNCNITVSDITSDQNIEVDTQLVNRASFNVAAVSKSLSTQVKRALSAAHDDLKTAFLNNP